MKITNTKEVTSRRFNALIVAESGIGKTFQARFFEPQDQTIIISAESGLLSLKNTDIDVIEINTFQDLIDAYSFLASGTKYKTVFIDSLTEIAEKLLADMKEKPEYSDKKAMFALYGDYATDLTKMIKAFRDLQSYNVIMTCLTCKEKDGLEMVDEISMPGQKVKDSIRAWFDEVLHLQIFEHDGQKIRKFITDASVSRLAKDRSGTLQAYEDANIGEVMKKVLA